MRERYTTINHNDDAVEHLHMKRVPGTHLRARKKLQERVRRIVTVNIDQLRCHDEFEALTM